MRAMLLRVPLPAEPDSAVPGVHRFRLADIQEATHGFSSVLGEGGFGTGVLQSHGGEGIGMAWVCIPSSMAKLTAHGCIWYSLKSVLCAIIVVCTSSSPFARTLATCPSILQYTMGCSLMGALLQSRAWIPCPCRCVP